MPRWLRALPLLCPAIVAAQGLTLSNGNLLVNAGTTLSVDGALTFSISPGATVVNHGRIDLGTEATLLEQPGAPITGDGFEEATWPVAAPLNSAEPGGLGLTLTTAYAEGGLRVERGHLPRTAWNGAEGIRRWYRVSVPGATAATLDAVLHYDGTELNAIMPSALALFSGPSATGAWTASPTLLNAPAQTLTASAPAPEVFITAFDLDAANGLAFSDPDGWSCWPRIIEDACWIGIPQGGSLREAVLIAVSGHMVQQFAFAEAIGVQQVAVPALRSGAYVLRLNGGERSFTLIKP
jgi:hypothetical protein